MLHVVSTAHNNSGKRCIEIYCGRQAVFGAARNIEVMEIESFNNGTMLAMLNMTSDSAEVFFADALELFLSGDRGVQSVLDVVARFRGFCASKALMMLLDDTEDAIFADWDLETKVWDLVHVMWLFRLEQHAAALLNSSAMLSGSSLALCELLHIIAWLQRNTVAPIMDADTSINYVEDQKSTRDFIPDGDSFLANSSWVGGAPTHLFGAQSHLPLNKLDDSPASNISDSNVFQTIYRLLLCRRLQDAVSAAQESGKYALALILLGASHEFSEPTSDTFTDVFPSPQPRFKHISLWRNTVHTLSQLPGLDKYERLIYNFLSGGDISENLHEAADDWEHALLLYLNQLYLCSVQEFIDSSSVSDHVSNAHRIRSVLTIQNALDRILNPDCPTSTKSKHPLRVISGSVMLGNERSLIETFTKSIAKNAANDFNSPRTLRVVTHIAILQSALADNISCEDLAASITLYAANLVDKNVAEAMPIYLAFIPDRHLVQDTYSMFLTTMTDQSQRTKQLSAARRIASILDAHDDESHNLQMLENVLRMTVARVIDETAHHYSQESSMQVDITADDPIDYTLYRAVQWYYDNNMWEDAILASIIVVRRFLLNFKLASFVKFFKITDWRKLIAQYDSDSVLRAVGDDTDSLEPDSLVSPTDREEVLEYISLATALDALSEWQSLGSRASETAAAVHAVIYEWLVKPIDATGAEILVEMRTNYVPYLTIELLGVYDKGRHDDPSFATSLQQLILDVANDEEFDLLACMIRSGKLEEFLHKAAQVSLSAFERVNEDN